MVDKRVAKNGSREGVTLCKQKPLEKTGVNETDQAICKAWQREMKNFLEKKKCMVKWGRQGNAEEVNNESGRKKNGDGD